MTIAFYLMMALVAGTPALAFLDGLPLYGALAVAAAAALGIVAVRIQPGEAAHFVRLARPALLLAALPILWMILQIVPAGVLAHPIWQSAGAALGETWSGSISVDTGASLLALGHILTALAIGFAVMALTIDRRRAELCLLIVTLTTGLMALTIVVHDLGGFTFLGVLGTGVRASFDAAAGFGVVLGLAFADLAVERFETRRQAGMTVARLVERLVLAFETLLVGAVAVSFFQADAVWTGPLAGAVVFSLVVLVRRFDVGRWGRLGVAAAAVTLVMLVIGPAVFDSNVLALRSVKPPVEAAASIRVLDDAPWAGTGAGTFPVVTALYPEARAPSARAPTTATIVSVELGRPFFWLFVLLACVLAGHLVRGALGRGRDSFYSAAAGACVVVLLLQSLRDASLLGPSMTVLAPAVVGLGLGQVAGRRLDFG